MLSEKHVCCDAALIACIACGKESQCVGRYHNNSLHYTDGGNLFSQYGKLHLPLEHVNVAQHLHVTPISLLLPMRSVMSASSGKSAINKATTTVVGVVLVHMGGGEREEKKGEGLSGKSRVL